jgi:stage II sporulation protein D
MDAPLIKVGIMAEMKVFVTLVDEYLLESSGIPVRGKCLAELTEHGIILETAENKWYFSNVISLVPSDPEEGKFILHDVTFGIDFHWQRKENQVFKGGLLFIINLNKIQVINVLSIEDYLTSVISSEMNSNASVELLKAHAVISRSWLLAQIQKIKFLQTEDKKYRTTFRTDDELIRWYDREDHTLFDVCADDHCQRYQGITRSVTPQVQQAVNETRGQILSYEGLICDARYSKCCGGMTEVFENVWEPINHPYLQKNVDNNVPPEGFDLQLDHESSAKKWIKGSPSAFCNCRDKNILKQVLNDYDQETDDFFRWTVAYTQEELSDLVKIKSGIDCGKIVDLIPVERGGSGRLIKLKIIGTLRTITIGKELEIRKTLSRSHLYSAAFIIERHDAGDNLSFVLHGAGWGHGVGLCQIGAAVMGNQGYSYKEILMHYFRGAVPENRY